MPHFSTHAYANWPFLGAHGDVYIPKGLFDRFVRSSNPASEGFVAIRRLLMISCERFCNCNTVTDVESNPHITLPSILMHGSAQDQSSATKERLHVELESKISPLHCHLDLAHFLQIDLLR